jgi:hypothetical protein
MNNNNQSTETDHNNNALMNTIQITKAEDIPISMLLVQLIQAVSGCKDAVFQNTLHRLEHEHEYQLTPIDREMIYDALLDNYSSDSNILHLFLLSQSKDPEIMKQYIPKFQARNHWKAVQLLLQYVHNDQLICDMLTTVLNDWKTFETCLLLCIPYLNKSIGDLCSNYVLQKKPQLKKFATEFTKYCSSFHNVSSAR